MTDQSPLIVPITVEAVVVNDHFRNGGNVFVRSQMQYGLLGLGLNGQASIDQRYQLHRFGLCGVGRRVGLLQRRLSEMAVAACINERRTGHADRDDDLSTSTQSLVDCTL